MDRYIESVKNSLNENVMVFDKYFIHPEEYGNEKLNQAIKDGVSDIKTIDTKLKDLATSTNELLEKTVKRLDTVKDIINAEKERLQDIVMLCNDKTDYKNAISLTDKSFSGNFNYEDGVFSCKSTNSSIVTGEVESIEGNGYVGNKYVKTSSGYQESTLSTKSPTALLDNNISTYWEYSRITASSTEEYLISDFHTDDAEANCTITFKLTSEANELVLKSSLNTVKVIGVRYSSDGIKYNDLDIMPFTINQKDESYKNEGYIYGSNIISFPNSKYIKISLQSVGYLNETLAFERTITKDDSEEVDTYTTVVPSAKRHVIRINDILFRQKKYNDATIMKSKELIDSDLNIFAISVFANTYLPNSMSEQNIEFTLTVNGNDYTVIPVNSIKNGKKIIRFSQGKIPAQYTQYIGEKIQSAYLTIKIKPKSNLTPYINNLKILLGDEI